MLAMITNEEIRARLDEIRISQFDESTNGMATKIGVEQKSL